MCGRFTLRTSADVIAKLFEGLICEGLTFPKLKPRYNICPTQPATCLRQTSSPVDDTSEQRTHEIAGLRWGLIPFWAKDMKSGARMINARSETVATKPAFRSAFKSRRCLVIADGFYEWKKVGSQKQPHYISRRDDQPFCMAGLWESWTDSSSEEPSIVETCTVLTTEANATMQPLHDRMPVMLAPEQFEIWLDNQFHDAHVLQPLMVPQPEGELQTFPVDKMVGKPANDVPECIEPINL
jgi:putative SOS response-associated peptidase YedK